MSCHAPIFHKKKNSKSYESFPCGKCAPCRALRTNGWVFRLLQEERVCYSAYFITLTYDDSNLPTDAHGRGELRKCDLQKFFKRLRKFQSSGVCKMPKRIKYYGVGEYGGRLGRPHYHVILFNAIPELVEKAWTLGRIHYGDVCGRSIAYTLKYISKPDKKSGFTCMSKGIGESYLSPVMLRWHNNNVDKRCYVINEYGVKMVMPRYYRDRIYSRDEKKVISYFAKQQQLRDELARTALEEFNLNETKKFKLKKLAHANNKKSVVEAPLQCRGISKALRDASRSFINSSRPNNVTKGSTRKIHKRTAVAVS